MRISTDQNKDVKDEYGLLQIAKRIHDIRERRRDTDFFFNTKMDEDQKLNNIVDNVYKKVNQFNPGKEVEEMIYKSVVTAFESIKDKVVIELKKSYDADELYAAWDWVSATGFPYPIAKDGTMFQCEYLNKSMPPSKYASPLTNSAFDGYAEYGNLDVTAADLLEIADSKHVTTNLDKQVKQVPEIEM